MNDELNRSFLHRSHISIPFLNAGREKKKKKKEVKENCPVRVWAGRPGLPPGSRQEGQVYPECGQGGLVYRRGPDREARSTLGSECEKEGQVYPGIHAGKPGLP